MLNKKALAASVSAPPATFVEDVFSTYLYTGNNSTQTINNGVDLAGEGGLVWIKSRSAAQNHQLFDTNRGNNLALATNLTDGNDSGWSTYFNFQSTGFGLGPNGWPTINGAGSTYCSWTFRKQVKFMDIVTWTGNGSSNRQISHSLGSAPGMMIVKCTSTSGNWSVYHRSRGATERGILNLTNAFGANNTIWNDTAPTSTVFTVGDNAGVNADGATYVAYLFAHNAGGFGAAGTDNVISCGSFTTNGSGIATVDLGYEPQLVLWKQTDGADNWYLNDVMRGMSVGQSDLNLSPNTSGAESAGGYETDPTATGFIANPGIASKTYIYMAIRRPMKVPTTGTEVFKPVARTGTDSSVTIDAGFPVDLSIASSRNKAIQSNTPVVDRLRGGGVGHPFLTTNTTDAESTGTASGMYEFTPRGIYTYNTIFNSSSETYVHWMFKRASGFMDVVCYNGNSTAGTTINHNLGVAPELMIIKRRNTGGTSWFTYSSATGNASALLLDTTDAAFNASVWNNTTPTSSVFSLGTGAGVNQSASTFVAYLFATLAGVSKVGSYTGTGSTQTINCGFTGGARFVLIKRTDEVASWFVWDTARGMVSGTDPRLVLNGTGAESNADWVLTATTGFQIVTSNVNVNASGGSYIYLAIA